MKLRFRKTQKKIGHLWKGEKRPIKRALFFLLFLLDLFGLADV
jgi:hypothetical protein